MQLYNRPNDLTALIELALTEDIGNGDITTSAIFSGVELATAKFIAKENGVIAGLELVKHIFSKISSELEFDLIFRDGNNVKRGDLVATVSGPANYILIGERTVLNFMQRMSGIATLTHLFVNEISHTKANILDTRKTIPGHRITDKWAVLIGGGQNHRIRLDDRFLIKENHIAVAGGISEAITSCIKYKKSYNLDAKIEIEVQNNDELQFVLKNHPKDVTFVMLDNMRLSEMSESVELNKGIFKLEASGNVTLESVRSIAETGVDFISSGSITHSVKALDISLLIDL